LGLGAITGPNGLWVPSQVMWQANLEPTWEGSSWPCNKCAETPHLSIPLSFQSPLPLRIHLLRRGRGGHCGGDEVGGYCRSPAIGGDWTDIGWRGVEGLGGHLNLAKTVAVAVEDGGEIATAW